MSESNDSAQSGLKEIVSEVVDQHVKSFSGNLNRVIGLVNIYIRRTENKSLSEQDDNQDILRAAVVLMHASLEEYLRQLAMSFLQFSDESVLDKIPLVDFIASGRAGSFLLGRLKKHKGKSVDELINESIHAYLEKSNYNNITDIKVLLKQIGIEEKVPKDTLSVMAEMIERRHQIVHRADNLKSSEGAISTTPIEPEQVVEWLKALVKFFQAVATPAAIKHLISYGHVRIEKDGTVTILTK